LEVLKKSDVAFTRVQLDTVGKSVVQTLTNALWYNSLRYLPNSKALMTGKLKNRKTGMFM
jgi:hypothetical protein